MKTTMLAVLAVLAFGSVAVEAQQAPQAKKYLVLGADPQAKDRQPRTDEEVVVIDQDICDGGWGSGSGKKIAGCYPRHSAVIRNKVTGIVTAMYVCGNEPSEKHTVSGKVVPAAEIVFVAGPAGPQGPVGPVGPQGPPGVNGRDGRDLLSRGSLLPPIPLEDQRARGMGIWGTVAKITGGAAGSALLWAGVKWILDSQHKTPQGPRAVTGGAF